MLDHYPRYASRATAFRVDAQGQDAILHHATGQVIGHKKPLVAEFAIFGPTFIPRDETTGEPLYRDQYGNPYESADIRGKYWDSRSAQELNGWTDEETQAVIEQVEYFCRTQPGEVWRLDTPKVGAPFPTFDDSSDSEVATVAVTAGLVMESLDYARQEGREGVVELLEAHVREALDAEQAEQALTVKA